MGYHHEKIETAWQEFWDKQGTFIAREDPTKQKFYALDMFPYPSAKGLHVGHPAGYTAGDVVCRYKRARGFNVLHPMGFDAFGLPAEQKAIEEGVPPQLSTAESIATFRRQLKRLGFSYDWTREVSTADPAYYKWTQYIFTLLYKQGLAYQGDMFVNWCPALGTVLANDEVIDGKSERGGHPVERKKMRQWMLRITAFAERLLEGLDRIDWPEATKQRQREWIGRSEGAFVEFPVEGTDEKVKVFTTRPDTLWGATYLVLAPEHQLVEKISTPVQKAAVEAYQKFAGARSDVDRQASKEKTGVDTGARARNPATGELIPIWIADYVLAGYGTGAIMAVPAHDERDWAFAKVMHLPIVEVITGGNPQEAAHTGEGAMTNSGPFDGTPTANRAAIRKVIEWLEQKGAGQGTVTYKFRDWVFARQRYWGEPIPVLKTKDGEPVRTLELDELPLELPAVKNYAPSGTGASPLASAPEWVNVHDPKTGQDLVRETDTMPGSAGSSWYFLRFTDPLNAAAFAARDKTDYWMPVDLYVGGPEHSVGHLMYSRMWQKALYDLGLVRDDEPFAKLRHQGMIQGETFYDEGHVVPADQVEARENKYFRKGTERVLTRTIEKMSKRKGNVVNPDEVIRDYGADALRIYLCFLGPLEASKPWQTIQLEGQVSWLKRVWRLFFEGDNDTSRVDDSEPTVDELKVIHKAIKKVTADIEALNLNTAISALHIATRDLTALGTRSRKVLEPFIQLIAPYAPHFAEEVWAKGLGYQGGITYVPWPQHDDRYAVSDTITMGVQVKGKTVATIELAPDADEATAVELARQQGPVAKLLGDKPPSRVIYKAGRILNLIPG